MSKLNDLIRNDQRFRNKVMVIGFIIMTIISITSFLGAPLTSGIILAIILETSMSSFLLIWHIRRWNGKLLQYLSLVSISLVFIMFTQFLPDYSNYSFVFLLLLIGAMSKDIKVYLCSSIIGAIAVYYMLANQKSIMNVSSPNQSLSYDWTGIVLNDTVYFVLPAIGLFCLLYGDRLLNNNISVVHDNSENLTNNLIHNKQVIGTQVSEISKYIEIVDEVSRNHNASFQEMKIATNEMGLAFNEQTHSIYDINSAMKESADKVSVLISSIQRVKLQVEDTSKESENGKHLVSEVNTYVDELLDIFESLHNNINELQDFSTEVIDMNEKVADLAKKTKILSINATIEAAHAGQYGKGFAVVAGEIRNLSSQTASLSSDISDRTSKIANSAVKTNQSLQSSERQLASVKTLVDRTKTVFMNVDTSINQVSDKTFDMTDVANGIGNSVYEVGGSLELFSTALEQNTATVQQLVSTVETLAYQNIEVSNGFEKVTHSIRALQHLQEERKNDGKKMA